MRRWAVLLLLGIALLVITIVKPYRNGPAIRSDGVGYHVWTYAFLKGDIHFSWIPSKNWQVYRMVIPDRSRNRLGCIYPPGVALVRFPLMAFVADPKRPELPFSSNEHLACLIAAALALIGTVWLSLRACERLGASGVAANAAVLMLTFGTGLFHYATYDGSFSHVYSALGTALILMLAVRAVEDKEGFLAALPTALTLTMMVLIRNTNVLTIAFWSVGLFGWAWGRNVRSARCWLYNAAVVAFGVGLGVGIQMAINRSTYGRFELNSYQHGKTLFNFSRSMLPEVLFSWDRGLFVYYPIFGLALLLGFLARRTRLLTAWLAVVILTYAAIYGFWVCWNLGAGFGHRGFVDIVPLAAPCLALALTHLGRWGRIQALSAGTLCVAVSVLIMIGYWKGTFPFEKATRENYVAALTLDLYKPHHD